MKYNAFHRLSYGLYIVTTRLDNKNAGYVGNTVFQVTSQPAQIAISCHKNNDSLEKILKSKIFAVSVLSENTSTSLIGEFGFMSGSELDKFRNVNTITSVTGAPIIINSVIAWFDCKVVSTLDVGSHILIIGEVLESDVISDEEPLTYAYYREKYKMLSPRNSPTYIEKEKLEPENKTVKKSAKSQEQPEVTKAGSETDIYICTICGYQYDPDEGDPSANIEPGTPFDELPDDYKCPICNAPKEYFKKA